MNPALTLRFAIYAPIFIGGGIYCWRYGIRWTAKTTIKGIPTRIAAVLLFMVAAMMILTVIFPNQTAHYMDQLDGKLSSPPTRQP